MTVLTYWHRLWAFGTIERVYIYLPEISLRVLPEKECGTADEIESVNH
jgi:hypothetical protein